MSNNTATTNTATANAAVLTSLMLQGINSLQAMATLQARVQAEGRAVSLDDLKALRDVDGAMRQQLEVAITAHGG